MPPKAGTKYTYSAEDPLGLASMPVARRQHRLDAVNPDVEDEDPDVAEVRRAHHRQDMHPGTEVTVREYDNDRDLVILEWTDEEGNDRATSVEPDNFTKTFKKVG